MKTLIKDNKPTLDNYMHVGLLLLDSSKAFDRLAHRLLIHKLNMVYHGNLIVSCTLIYMIDYRGLKYQQPKAIGLK